MFELFKLARYSYAKVKPEDKYISSNINLTKIFFRIFSGIEHVTIPLSLNNIINSSTVCLKIEQDGDMFVGRGSWFVDDLVIVRSRLQSGYVFEKFEAMKTSNWYRLVGGQLQVVFYLIKNNVLLIILRHVTDE